MIRLGCVNNAVEPFSHEAFNTQLSVHIEATNKTETVSSGFALRNNAWGFPDFLLGVSLAARYRNVVTL